MTNMDKNAIEKLGYICPMQDSAGNWYAISSYIFTAAIIGPITPFEFENRWCYDSIIVAAESLVKWKYAGFVNEPQNWIKHYPSLRLAEKDNKGLWTIKKITPA